MALPKHRKSKAKTRMHRAHQGLVAIGLVECPNCGEPCQPHKVCSACGFYKDREIINKS